MAEYCVKLVFLSSLILGALAGELSDLHVKFAFLDGYYGIPTTMNKAVSGSYKLMGHDNGLNVSLLSYFNDPRFSIIFDSFGNIGGIRTCYIKDDVGKRAKEHGLTFPYDFSALPMYSSHVYWNTSVWCTSVLFVDPDKLKAGGRNDTHGLVAEDVYVKLNGNFTKMPRDECDVVSQGFTKQACFIGMGMHYFYGMTPTANCSSLQGVFLLYESGSLIGLGIIPFGSFNGSPKRTWNEDPPSSVVKRIVPNRPDCLISWVENYGTTSLHIFFKKWPRLTFCCWPWQDSNKCAVREFINDVIDN